MNYLKYYFDNKNKNKKIIFFFIFNDIYKSSKFNKFPISSGIDPSILHSFKYIKNKKIIKYIYNFLIFY